MTYTFVPQNFVDQQGPAIKSAWLNALDQAVNNVLQGATSVAQLQQLLQVFNTLGFANGVVDTALATQGQTTFGTSLNPTNAANLTLTLDGLELVSGVDFTLSGQTITFLAGSFPSGLTIGQRIAARYYTALPSGAIPNGSVLDASLSPLSTLYGVVGNLQQTAAEVAAGVTPTNVAYPPLNPFRYGALANGSADDYGALQKAVSVAQVNGGTVYLPGGYTFRSSKNLNVTGSNVRIAGDGAGSILQFTDTANRYSGITFTGSSGSYLANPVVENCQVIGAGYGSPFGAVQSGSGILASYVTGLRVNNVVLHEWSDNGIATGNGTAANGVQLTNNVIYNCNQGISAFRTASNLIVTGNHVYNIRYYVGIQIEGSGGTDNYAVVSNNVVHTCDGSVSNAADGIQIQLCPYAVVTGNLVYGVTGGTGTGNGNGIYLYGSPYTTAVGNLSYSNTGYGISVSANCGNCSVAGNVTFNNSLGGLLLTDGGVSSSLNVVVSSSNNFVEGPITKSGSVSLTNQFGNVVANKGTFTPVVVGTTTPGITTGGTTSAEYTVIDNVVNFTLTISYSASSGVGNIQVNGLPFTCTSTGPVAVNLRANGLAFTSGNQIMAEVTQSGTSINISQMAPSNGALTGVPLPTSGLAGLTISGQYPTS